MIHIQAEPEPFYLMDEGLEARDVYRHVQRAVGELTEREREVLHYRFFDDETLKEIGSKYGLTSTRIGQIEAKALRRIRHRMHHWLKGSTEREEYRREELQKEKERTRDPQKEADSFIRKMRERSFSRDGATKTGRQSFNDLCGDWYGTLWRDHVNAASKCLAVAGLDKVRGKMTEITDFNPRHLTESLYARLRPFQPQEEDELKAIARSLVDLSKRIEDIRKASKNRS